MRVSQLEPLGSPTSEMSTRGLANRPQVLLGWLTFASSSGEGVPRKNVPTLRQHLAAGPDHPPSRRRQSSGFENLIMSLLDSPHLVERTSHECPCNAAVNEKRSGTMRQSPQGNGCLFHPQCSNRGMCTFFIIIHFDYLRTFPWVHDACLIYSTEFSARLKGRAQESIQYYQHRYSGD